MIVITKQANTICRTCKKLYYSCLYCTHTANWRSVCCSEDCYNEYVEQINKSRSKNKTISQEELLPGRIDMTKNEIIELMQKPLEEVIEQTKEELKDYAEDLEEFGFAGTVDKINRELDEHKSKNKKKKTYKFKEGE